MATCYLCGAPNANYRREVHTGRSIGVWFGRRISSGSRNYYGIRSVCANCAESIDKSSGCGTVVLWVLLVIGVGVFLIFFSKGCFNSTTPSKQKPTTSTTHKSVAGNSDICRIVSNKGINLRSEANSNSVVLSTIPYNETVRIISTSTQSETIAGLTGNWYEVEYNGTKGWIFSGFVERQ